MAAPTTLSMRVAVAFTNSGMTLAVDQKTVVVVAYQAAVATLPSTPRAHPAGGTNANWVALTNGASATAPMAFVASTAAVRIVLTAATEEGIDRSVNAITKIAIHVLVLHSIELATPVILGIRGAASASDGTTAKPRARQRVFAGGLEGLPLRSLFTPLVAC